MKNEIETYLNHPLREYTTYRIGGPAKKLCIPKSVSELERIYKSVLEGGEAFFILGGGSNVLISDRGFDGTVILMSKCCNKISSYGSQFSCGAGVKLKSFIENVIKSGYSGLERLFGIPGTLGGALTMNAGAYRSEISDWLDNVNVMDEWGNYRRIPKEEIRFAYRSAPGLHGKLILSGEFCFPNEDRVGTAKLAGKIALLRQSKHPWQYPSAGSVFKKSPFGPAGKLIDQLGLKGMRIGEAKISTKHGNFIINLGKARAIEVLALIKRIQNRVLEEYEIELDLEQKLIGFTPAEIEDPERFL